MGWRMFCSKGIFSAVLFSANKISLLTVLILDWDGSLTWLIGPHSWPVGFFRAMKGFCTCGYLRYLGTARLFRIAVTLQSPLELEIFCEQEWAYDRINLFPPLHPFFSWVIVLNDLTNHEIVDMDGLRPQGQQIWSGWVPGLPQDTWPFVAV